MRAKREFEVPGSTFKVADAASPCPLPSDGRGSGAWKAIENYQTNPIMSPLQGSLYIGGCLTQGVAALYPGLSYCRPFRTCGRLAHRSARRFRVQRSKLCVGRQFKVSGSTFKVLFGSRLGCLRHFAGNMAPLRNLRITEPWLPWFASVQLRVQPERRLINVNQG